MSAVRHLGIFLLLRWRALVGLLVVGGLAGALAWWHPWRRDLPSPNTNILTLVKFVASPAFEDLSAREQRPYMAALRDNSHKITEAFLKGTISPENYEVAVLYTFMERRINEMETYFRTPPGRERDEYLDILIEGHAHRPSTTRPSTNAVRPDYNTFALNQIENWPPERRSQWAEFRAALKERRKARSATAPAQVIDER